MKIKRQIAQEWQHEHADVSVINKRIVLRAKDASLEIYNRNLKEKHVPKELRNIAELKEALRTAEKLQGIRPVLEPEKVDGDRMRSLNPNNWITKEFGIQHKHRKEN